MKTPDLRKYRHALVLAESGSYSRASELLHLSQSALTRSIQSLERELDIRLFDRSRRRVQLTRDGQTVLSHARILLLQAESLEREIRLLKHAESGVIAFGVGPAMPGLFLPDLLVQLNRTQPALSVEVVVDSPPQLLELLHEHRIEFFVADIRSLPDLDSRQIENEKLTSLPPAFFVRCDHPLTRVAKVTASELRHYTLLTPHYRDRSSEYPPAERQALSRIYCNDLGTLRQVVLETDAVLRGVQPMVKRELVDGSIRVLNYVDDRHVDPGSISLVHEAGGQHSATASTVLSQLRSLLRT